jgi:UDP-N-acetylmuramyl pentapeptide phosphotransferase/UDP-N-acetylglucosamine-1-phosphate transferase
MDYLAQPVLLWSFATPAAVCSILMFPACALLRRAGIIDRPNERSSHTQTTLRGGGVGIVLVILGNLFLAPGMPRVVAGIGVFALALVAGISFRDDLEPLGVRIRMGVHVAAALLLALALSDWSGMGPAFLLVAASVVWMVGYTNAFNFMDGINGLAAVQAITTGVGTAMLGLIGGLAPEHPAIIFPLAIAGAAFGFLPFNFPKARVFMGDVGSATLGLALAFAALWVMRAAGWWLAFPLVALHASFLLDTSLTMFRRWRRGDVIYHAHREHFYQLAVRSKLSHANVTGTVALGQAAVLAMLAAGTASGSPGWLALACGAVLLLWGVCFAWWAARFRRQSQQP